MTWTGFRGAGHLDFKRAMDDVVFPMNSNTSEKDYLKCMNAGRSIIHERTP